MKKLLLIYLVITSCISLSEKETKNDKLSSSIQNETIYPTLDRKVIHLTNPSASLEEIALVLFNNELKPSDIDQITQLPNENILHYGEVELIKINLASSVPNVIYGEYIILLNRRKREAVLFPLTNFQLINFQENDQKGLLAGTYAGRNFGFFTIYSYDGNGKFECIFTSLADKFCQDGLPTYNASLECISYDPLSLKFENKDINGDHLLDLVFSGEIHYFCEGLETGIGRLDREPLRKQEISFTFITKEDAATSFFTWELLDNDICELLK